MTYRKHLRRQRRPIPPPRCGAICDWKWSAEGSVGTPLAPSEWWIPVGALCVAPRTRIPQFASSAPVGAITESGSSAGEAALSYNAAGPAGAKTRGSTGMPSPRFCASMCLRAQGLEPRASLKRFPVCKLKAGRSAFRGRFFSVPPSGFGPEAAGQKTAANGFNINAMALVIIAGMVPEPSATSGWPLAPAGEQIGYTLLCGFLCPSVGSSAASHAKLEFLTVVTELLLSSLSVVVVALLDS